MSGERRLVPFRKPPGEVEIYTPAKRVGEDPADAERRAEAERRTKQAQSDLFGDVVEGEAHELKMAFYPEMAEDLSNLKKLLSGLGLKNPDRDENENMIRLITRRLKRAGVDTGQFPDFFANPKSDKVLEKSLSMFKDSIVLLNDKTRREFDPEYWDECKKYLELCGIDVERVIESLEAKKVASGPDLSPDDKGLDELLKSYEGLSQAQQAFNLQREISSIIRKTGKAAPKEYIQKLTELRSQIATVEIYDTDSRLLSNRDVGAETPLQKELRKPIIGGKTTGTIIDEQFGTPRGIEITVISPDKAINIDRLRGLLTTFWAEEMSRLTGEARDLQSVGQAIHGMSGTMQNLVDGLKASIAGLQRLDGRDLKTVLCESFPSLKPREGDPLGTRGLYDHFVETGFRPDDPKALEIPEVRVKMQLEGLCDLQIALSDELSVLRTLREKAQKVEESAETVIPFPSEKIAELWRIGKMFTGEDNLLGEEIRSIEDYQDEMMRMYWVIAKVSDLGPGRDLNPEDRAKIPLPLEKFIRDNLTVLIPITNEEGRKFERYVLNKWAYAPADKLKQIDEFILLSSRLGLFDLFRRGAGSRELTRRVQIFNEEFRDRLSGRGAEARKVGVVDSPAEVAVKFAKVRAETDILTFGLAEQMGSYILTRSVKQKGGDWDRSDMKKAVKNRTLYRVRRGAVLNPPGGSVGSLISEGVGSYELVTQYSEALSPAEHFVIERKATGYPASSDLVKLTRVDTKLAAEVAEGSSFGSLGLKVAVERGFIPTVWISNYFQSTKIIESGREISLWELWWNGDQKLSDIAGRVIRADRDTIDIDNKVLGGVVSRDRGVDSDAYTKWRKNIRATYSFWKLMRSEEKKDLQGFFSDDLSESFTTSSIYGMSLPELDAAQRKDSLSRLKGVVVASYYVLHYGFTKQQRGSELMRTKGEAATIGSSLTTDRIEMLMNILKDDKYLDQNGRIVFKTILAAFNADRKTGLINPTFGPFKWLDRWNSITTL